MTRTHSAVLSCLGLVLCACGVEDRASSAAERASGSSALAGSELAAAAPDGASGSGAAPGGADSSAAQGSLEPTPAPALAEAGAPAAAERVRWRPCGNLGDRNISCAEVYVPLDHADPEGERIAIALNRIATSRAHRRRGTLLYNPGGPGVSGRAAVLDPLQLAALDAVAPGYDFVGFDPRGMAASGDRGCSPFTLASLPYGTEQAPIDSTLPLLAQAEESPRCAESWGPLFDKLGSNQVVRDMEWLRQALGEPKLNFLGASYGTRLGALYAHHYPEQAGAIVLDAAVPPTVDLVQKTREVFAEQVRLTEYVLSLCEAGLPPCPSDARAVFARMVDTAAENGLLVEVMTEWVSALGAGALGALAALLSEVQAAGDASWLQRFAAPPAQETGFMSIATVNCIDATSAPPSLEQVEALYGELQAIHRALAPIAMVNAVMCAAWPVTRDPVPLPSAPDAPPLLVIGGGFDWRTPLAQAQAGAIGGSARLLVSNHLGHGAFLLGSECTKEAIRNFFLDGTRPPAGTVCDDEVPGAGAAPPGQLPVSAYRSRPAIITP